MVEKQSIMEITKLTYDNIGIARAIVRGDKTISYYVSIDGELLRNWCSCPKYVYSKGVCKHIEYVLNNLELDKMVNRISVLDKLSTGCETIDNLLGGGIPYGTITTIFGEPKVGKSMLGYQIGIASIKETGLKTLYIDTEGIRRQDFNSIVSKFNSRWGVDTKILFDKFEYTTTLGDLQLKSIQKLFQLFGLLPMIEMSKGGRYTVQFETCAPKIKEEQWKNYGMIIIDSMTAPLKMAIGSNTSNLPTRAQLTERLFGLLIEVAMRNNISVVVNHHASVDPMNLFGRDFGKAWGGDPILYNSKYALLIINADGNTKKTTGWGTEARRIMLVRRPDEQDTDTKHPVRLKKDFGYCDS